MTYTFSKAIDNIGAYSATGSSAEGNGFAPPIDNFNLRLMRGVADFNRPHVLSGYWSYALPIGRNKRFGNDMSRWLDAVVGGWETGGLLIWESGSPYTVLSQRYTAGYNSQYTWANYSGPTDIGSVQRTGAGVSFLTPDQVASFTFPGAGEIGTSGRNTFSGPRFFNIDASLVKRFKITETHQVAFRAEAYNLINNPNFGGLQTNLNQMSSFGKLTSTIGAQSTNARVMQMTLRYEF